MPRDGAQARLRLEQAALELYSSRGYDRTTTAEIAAAAGVTERTFFRQFADKREVLFGFESEARRELCDALAAVPTSYPPLATILRALLATCPFLERNRDLSERRQQIIVATPALRERQLAKAAMLTDTVIDALMRRGVTSRQASLAAHVGMAAFNRARHDWLDTPAGELATSIVRAFDDLRELVHAVPAGQVDIGEMFSRERSDDDRPEPRTSPVERH